MAKFSRSITRGSFAQKDGAWALSEDAIATLGEHAERVLLAFAETNDGVSSADASVETESDGAYDQFDDMIIHWRDDGWIDVVVHENQAKAESVIEYLSDLYYGD
jgi:hypothetical protein